MSVAHKLDELCHCLSFSPYKESSELLAIGGDSKITVKSCRYLADAELLESFSLDPLFSILTAGSVSHISWSPSTVHNNDYGKYILSSTGWNDHSITIYSCDIESTSSESLPGHASYINELSQHPTDSALLASVGDDCSCRVWDLNAGEQRSEFNLKAPGMAVKWHPQDPTKLLVAEVSGRIRFYDLSTEAPIMTLEAGTSPLMSVDWSPSNSLCVGGVAGGSWCVWDISQSSCPLERYGDGRGPASHFLFCPQSEGVFATVELGKELRVNHLGHKKIPISCDMHVISDVSWHSRLPVLGVASDRSIQLFMAEI